MSFPPGRLLPPHLRGPCQDDCYRRWKISRWLTVTSISTLKKTASAKHMDFFTLVKHYVLQDAVSAGLPRDSVEVVANEKASVADRWRAFEPFWKHVRFTGYGQALRIAVRDIYGVEEISAATLSKINDRMSQENKPGIYKRVLIDRGKILYSVLDDKWNAAPVKPDFRYFVYARRFDRFVTPAGRGDVEELEKLTGVSITSLAGLRRAMERSFEQSLDADMVTVKSTLAYHREIIYHEVEQADAERDFESLMAAQVALPEGFRTRFRRPFRQLEDHMFHHLIRLGPRHTACRCKFTRASTLETATSLRTRSRRT